MVDDYLLARQLQEREGTVMVAPPPPPPPNLPLRQLPFIPERKHLLFAQITKNRSRRLRPVNTVEKRAFKVGKEMVSCANTDQYNVHYFTIEFVQ